MNNQKTQRPRKKKLTNEEQEIIVSEMMRETDTKNINSIRVNLKCKSPGI